MNDDKLPHLHKSNTEFELQAKYLFIILILPGMSKMGRDRQLRRTQEAHGRMQALFPALGLERNPKGNCF